VVGLIEFERMLTNPITVFDNERLLSRRARFGMRPAGVALLGAQTAESCRFLVQRTRASREGFTALTATIAA
jgi:hypothetical protein